MQELMQELVPDAKKVLKKHLGSKDGKIAIMAANSILDRAKGRPGTAKPPQAGKKPAHIEMNFAGDPAKEQETQVDLEDIDMEGYA